ncbi:MAG: extracellular solute-binding protein [Spirochaetales bacterium]|nr:extracellular solute-binding protein [Spirochaetales bacterium]
MKKFLLILLCITLVGGFVFAKGKQEEEKTGAPKSITVEIYDRSNPGGSKPEDNFFTNFIKEGMLKTYNVQVTFKPVPRWTEVEVLNNLLAASEAPDICVTYSYPTIQTYANMGGVLDLGPYLKQYKAKLPNLWKLLGDQNIYWDRDPKTGTVWAIEALLFNNMRNSVFVREDWLKKLNIKEPTSLKEFEAMLKAFKDNASLLLGENADKMIPFAMSTDVGWRADPLSVSFIPDNISDKEMYINGFDDRRLLWPGIKEGFRVINKWYNDGLVWKDFPLYGPSDNTEGNLTKAGYVGAFFGNWDLPYRDGDNGIHANLKKLVGPDAAFIAIEPFKNNAGNYRKYLSAPVDRKVFFPATNKDPVSSLMYLEWIATLENRRFLQIGEEGVNHEKQADGSIKAIAAKGEKIMNSPNNIDYTILINGLDLGDPDLNIKSIALAYPGVDKIYLEKSYKIMKHDARVTPNFNVGEIKSEEGMGPALKEKRDTFLTMALVAKPGEFDAVYDAGMQDYLKSGGQAIIDERRARYEASVGK